MNYKEWIGYSSENYYTVYDTEFEKRLGERVWITDYIPNRNPMLRPMRAIKPIYCELVHRSNHGSYIAHTDGVFAAVNSNGEVTKRTFNPYADGNTNRGVEVFYSEEDAKAFYNKKLRDVQGLLKDEQDKITQEIARLEDLKL